MIASTFFLVLGLLLLVGGGDFLVRGAAGLARTFGISSLVIGMTVVAFGTSTPELAVNLAAVLNGKGGISFGNVIGSNLANLGLILGVTAILKPLSIQGRIIVREIPMMVLATIAASVMAFDPELRGIDANYDRTDGILLLLFFSVFLYTTIGDVVRRRMGDPLVEQLEEAEPMAGKRRIWLDVSLVGGGLVALVAGGQLTVEGASAIARSIGVSEVVIGLSLVAVGTSLPELVTSIMAAVRGETDIAIGNVVGSNLFNLLLILGVTSTVRTVPVPQGGWMDLTALLVVSLLLLPFSVTGRRRIVRLEGLAFFVLWLGYSIWRFAASVSA